MTAADIVVRTLSLPEGVYSLQDVKPGVNGERDRSNQ